MARIRSIKPEAFTSETLTAVPIPARWTFAGIWTYVDDQGRGKGDLRLIKAALYALDDDVTTADVEGHVLALEDQGLICRYEVDGRAYLHVTNFREHQHPSKPQESKLPECPREVHGPRQERSGSVPGTVRERSGSTPSGSSRGMGVVGEMEKEGKGTPAPLRGDGGAQLAIIASPEDAKTRAQRLTKTYAERVSMCNFSAVQGIVRKAMSAGKSDDEITGALARLADSGRSVTADSLRIEIEGATRRTSTTDQRVAQGLAISARLEEQGL